MDHYYKPHHECYFRCLYCGYEFDTPENDDLCPECFSECIAVNNRSNISHIMDKIKVTNNKLFYGNQQSVSYSTRQKKPIADRYCYIIGTSYRKYYPTYWNGTCFIDDPNQAVVYASEKYAQTKIYKSGMGNYCFPIVVKARLFGGNVIPIINMN